MVLGLCYLHWFSVSDRVLDISQCQASKMVSNHFTPAILKSCIEVPLLEVCICGALPALAVKYDLHARLGSHRSRIALSLVDEAPPLSAHFPDDDFIPRRSSLSRWIEHKSIDDVSAAVPPEVIKGHGISVSSK